ncbi:uncharacterized protein C5L36_0B01860 [Pichia kudriavzevii]|uniref:Coiled-coil domain-containing protein 47 n=1 Tax=Pichia kudriavzevii TaxID=4909 RepID=A0A1V2LL05_PICKU|nr:uncharacterized protein C5L36_0B01860 [Pichia kudriavzevii]AWU74922.1 hypothetical protein C5L36_0B01860 [Pichia kudriavzevii]ONH73241.1 Coiled-coil domain-containing protein 47 [Pichia kudriavzevii]
MASLNDYSPEEIVEMGIVQRLKLYSWKIELFAIAAISIYYLVYKLGAGYNEKVALNFINSILPTLKENFYQVGVTETQLFAKDDDQNYTLYASGRTKIQSMTAKIQLQTRQNLSMWAMEAVVGYFFQSVPAPHDIVTIEFKFDEETSDKFDNFIWAIVTKDKMDKFRTENYFLSLTKTSESPKLPLQFVFMNEVPEMNDVLFTKKLSDALKDNLDTLKFIAITDQPSEKPVKISELKPTKKVVLQFSISNNAKSIESIKNFFNYVLNDYLDLVANRSVFRPELTRKVKKTRENEYNKLKRILDDIKREELNNKKIEEQRKLKESMTPEEQQKLAKKQQERKQRKMLNRQKVRGSM